ncbi:hypothetical protein LB505_006364 [Fusarium chuoi]|nr:hypothetical protein LB505_006364 [Fusarium chuoi]
MHKNEGILHAIQSLAGVYIYDYIPDERIRQRINQRYITADQYFSTLLNAPESRENGKGQEVITMAVLLSMQDARRILSAGNRPWRSLLEKQQRPVQRTSHLSINHRWPGSDSRSTYDGPSITADF